MPIGLLTLTLLSLALVIYGAACLRRAANGLRYVEVPATLTQLQIVDKLDSARSYHKRWYAVEAHYYYEVSGHRYQASRVGWDVRSSWTESPDAAERLAAEIRRRACCFVDPDAPGRALLMVALPKSRRQHYWAITLAGLALAAATGLLWTVRD
ncbi:DUF3592 domain-containing protein [Roseateles asaccharophilus]|uniref:DUF3592 domain-containing protein n=1 Tax=Roseateles asaccharophilus TaxID=582607 RepID=A0ABU2A7I0_9BURK|nr:DUF3592 domain-containing protein [Roseateles asaccharophilus]MDR7332975.1 hypothetical protein [Roseateles asaccharophilus]